MKAMILAAGFGTRLLPYTRSTPKPLFTIAERPILDLAIRRLAAAGCHALIINTHHLHDQIDAFPSGQWIGTLFYDFRPVPLVRVFHSHDNLFSPDSHVKSTAGACIGYLAGCGPVGQIPLFRYLQTT